MKINEVNFDSQRTSVAANTTSNYSTDVINYNFLDQFTEDLSNRISSLNMDALRLHTLVEKCSGNSPLGDLKENPSIPITHKEKLDYLLNLMEKVQAVIWNNINSLETFI